MGAGGAKDVVLRPEEIEELADLSGFTQKDIRKLYKRFRKLDRSEHGYITRDDLMKIPELTMNPLVDRVMAIFDFAEVDRVNFTDFVKILSTFNENAQGNDKLAVAFNVFDIDRDGLISPDELLRILKQMVGPHMEEAELKKIVNRIIREADADMDGKLNFEEFKNTMLGSEIEQTLTVPPWHKRK